jgi:hypothetical protein
MLPVAAGANGQPPMPPIDASSTPTPASMAAWALAMPVCRVSCRWMRSGTAPVTARTAATRRCTSEGTATPIVSARATSSAPAATARRAMSTTRSVATSPSNGQPKLAAIVTDAIRPASWMVVARASKVARLASVVAPWLRRLKVSLATTT